jgi:hypothetical protein
MLDADLAAIYGVSTTRLNQQYRRNRSRFPSDFAFEVPKDDAGNLMLQNATSSWGGRRKPPLAFTEHGAVMVATVLNTPRAVEMSVYVVRAFIELRATATAHAQLAHKLDAIEKTVAVLDADSRRQFKELRTLVFSLAMPPPKEQ